MFSCEFGAYFQNSVYNFIKIAFRLGCSPVNLVDIFKTLSTGPRAKIIPSLKIVRSSSWWKEDETIAKGTHLEAPAALHHFH